MPSDVSVIEPISPKVGVWQVFPAKDTGYYYFKANQAEDSQNILILADVLSGSEVIHGHTLYVPNFDVFVPEGRITFPVVRGQTVRFIVLTSDSKAPSHVDVKFVYSIGSAKELGLI